MIQRSMSETTFVVAPLLDVLLHRDVLRLPVVGLHRPVEVVGPLVLQREEVEAHGLAAIDDSLGGEGGFGLRLIEDERLGTDLKRFVHGQRTGREAEEWRKREDADERRRAFLGRKGR